MCHLFKKLLIKENQKWLLIMVDFVLNTANM